MKISYGIAESHQANIGNYVNAREVIHWQLVRSVLIRLLLSSTDAVYTKPQSILFDHQWLPADKKLRKAIDIYIALREPQ
jgi:type IV secretory pathway component VirB8